MPAKQSQTAETPIETQAKRQQQTLVIGRIVHFVATDGSERAAIVTRVYEVSDVSAEESIGMVDLAVFTTAEEHGKQGAVYGYGNATYDAGGTKPSSWHWPAEGKPHPEQLSPNSWSSSDSDSTENSSTENSGATGAS